MTTTEIKVYQTTNGNWRGAVDGVVHPRLAGSTLPVLLNTATALFPTGFQLTLARNGVRLAATPLADVGDVKADPTTTANAVQALKSERDAALDVVAELLGVVDDFMPNVGRCNLQNYQRLNEAPFKARRLLMNAGRK